MQVQAMTRSTSPNLALEIPSWYLGIDSIYLKDAIESTSVYATRVLPTHRMAETPSSLVAPRLLHVSAGAANDSLYIKGAITNTTAYGGKGNDTLSIDGALSDSSTVFGDSTP